MRPTPAGPAPIASEALDRIKALYAIEGEIRGLEADARRALRQQRSLPVIQALEPWLRARLETISQKTKLAEAIRYALSRWAGLTLFLEDGRIELDNNIVERSIRPLALSRKNSLFAGSDGGVEYWAILASLRDCQAQRHRPTGLHLQRHQPHRRRTPAERHRSAAALEPLGHRRRDRPHGVLGRERNA